MFLAIRKLGFNFNKPWKMHKNIKLNPLMPGGNKNVMHLKAASLFKYV